MIGAVGVGATDHLLPGQIVVLDVASEPGVLLPVAGENRDETPFAAGDVVQIGPVAELAIRHIQEVGAPRQLAEGLPCLDVGGVVVRVPIAQSVVHWHRPVGTDREDPEQLLEVGAMVLVVAMGDGYGLPAADPAASGLGVGARESNGRRVVVELVELDAESLDGADDDGGHQGRPVRVEQPVEGPPHPVVVQAIDLVRFQPKQGGQERLCPLLEPIDRPASEEDVAQEDAEGSGRTDPAAPVHVGHILLKERIQPQAVKHVLKQRQGAERL
ncbi:hypothetical protein GALL_430300 [mine drainage metagenome]|uniref:Uncharacterized protein n=1 Tax=mine drainage metagenome TaxID=410659 RepID=A0A1J5PUL9_9ZZZZ